MTADENQQTPVEAAVEMVYVLNEDPELGSQLSGRPLELAKAQAIAPLLRLEPQVWSDPRDDQARRGHLGLLILDGLVARYMRFGEIGSTEFLGPRDVIRPWRRPRSRTHTVEVRWEVLAPARIADLDRDFALRIRTWPEIVAVLGRRSSERSDAQLFQSALRQAVRVEDRLVIALWHFAERWGRATAEGWTIEIPRLTGEVLASIVGARRQSVSTALGQLADRGVVRRTGGGTWIVTQLPAQLESVEVGSRASDRQSALPDITGVQ